MKSTWNYWQSLANASVFNEVLYATGVAGSVIGLMLFCAGQLGSSALFTMHSAEDCRKATKTGVRMLVSSTVTLVCILLSSGGVSNTSGGMQTRIGNILFFYPLLALWAYSKRKDNPFFQKEAGD